MSTVDAAAFAATILEEQGAEPGAGEGFSDAGGIASEIKSKRKNLYVTDPQIRHFVDPTGVRFRPLPTIVQDFLQGTVQPVKFGVWAEIGRAWAILDTRVIIWDYRQESNVLELPAAASSKPGRTEELALDQHVCCVGLVPPRPGAFDGAVKYLIVIATETTVYLLPTSFKPYGSHTGPMSVEFDPELQVVGEPNTKTCIAGTSDGRIFVTGWDGSLAEISYSSDREHSENPLSMLGMAKRTRSVLHTASLSWIVPSWVTSMAGGRVAEPLESVVVDHWRSLLYTLSRDGTIVAYKLVSGAAPERTAVLGDNIPGASFTSAARRACGPDDPLQSAAASSADVSAAFTAVALHVVDPLHSGNQVHVVAVTGTGARAMLRLVKSKLFVVAFVSPPSRPDMAAMTPTDRTAGVPPSAARAVASFYADGVFLLARHSADTEAAADEASAASSSSPSSSSSSSSSSAAAAAAGGFVRGDTEVTSTSVSPWRLRDVALANRRAEEAAAAGRSDYAAYSDLTAEDTSMFEQVEPLEVVASQGLAGSVIAIAEEPRPPTLLRTREYVPSGCISLCLAGDMPQVSPLPMAGSADNMLHAEAADGASRIGAEGKNGSTGLQIDRYSLASFPVVPFPASVDVLTRARRAELDASAKASSRLKSTSRRYAERTQREAPDASPLTELALQAQNARAARTFVVVSTAGVSLVTRLRPADILRKAAKNEATGYHDRTGRASLMDMASLVQRYGAVETVAACALINEEAEFESGDGFAGAASVANEGGIARTGAQPVMHSVARLVASFVREARLNASSMGGTIEFSPAFRGLCLHLSRVLRPVWGQPLFAASHVPSPDVIKGEKYTTPTASQIFGMASGEGRFLVPRFEPRELGTIASRLDSIYRFIDTVYGTRKHRVTPVSAATFPAAAGEHRAEAKAVEQRCAASLASFCDLAAQTLHAVGWLSRGSWKRHPDPAPLHSIVALDKTNAVVDTLRLRDVVLAVDASDSDEFAAASAAAADSARSAAFTSLVRLVREKVKMLRYVSTIRPLPHKEVDEDVRVLAARCPAFFSGSDERLDAAKKLLEPDQSDAGALIGQRRRAVKIVREALASWDPSKGTSLDDLEQIAASLCQKKHNDIDAALSLLVEAELSAARIAGVAVQGGGGGAASAAAAAASSSSAGVRGVPASRRLRGMMTHTGGAGAMISLSSSSAGASASVGGGYGAGTDDPTALEAQLTSIEKKEEKDAVRWMGAHKRRLSSAAKLADSPALLAQWARLECARVMLRWFIGLSDDKLCAWASEVRHSRSESVEDAVKVLLARVIEMGPSNLLVLALCRFAAQFDPREAAAAAAPEHRGVSATRAIARRVKALENALWVSDHAAVTVFLRSRRHDTGSKRRFGMYIEHLERRGEKAEAAQEYASRALTGRGFGGTGPTLEERSDCLRHAIRFAETAQPPMQEAVVTTWRAKLQLVHVQQSLHKLAIVRGDDDLRNSLEIKPPEVRMLLESANKLRAFHASMSVLCLQQSDSASGILETFRLFLTERDRAIRARVTSSNPVVAADEWDKASRAMVVPPGAGSPDHPESLDVSQTAALLLHPDSPAGLSVARLVNELERMAYTASVNITDRVMLANEQLWDAISVRTLGAVHSALARQLAGRPTRLSLPARLAAYMTVLNDNERADPDFRLQLIRSTISLLTSWIIGSRSQDRRADSAQRYTARIREAVDRMMAMLNSGAADAEAAHDDAGLDDTGAMTGALKERLRVITGEVEAIQARYEHML